VTAPAWRLVWEWGGYRGTAEDIDPQWSEVAELYGGGTSRRQVTVTLWPRGLSVAAVVEAGAHPMGGYGTLYLGERIVIAGRWIRPEYGADGEPLTITISESDADDRGVWPPVGMEARAGWGQAAQASRARRLALGDEYRAGFIDETAWPACLPTSIGIAYPIVIGSPGTETAPAVPAPVVVAPTAPAVTVEVCVSGAAASGSVLVFGTDASAPGAGVTPAIIAGTAPVSMTGATDGYGVQVTVASFASGTTGSGGNGLDFSDGATYYTAWTDAAGLPGGAGDLIAMIATASSARLDIGAFGASASFLNRYRFDGYFDDRVSPLALIRAQFLPLLPVSLVSGPDGLGPVVWPWVDGGHHPTMHLVERPDFVRASRVGYAGEGLTSVVMSFGYDASQSLYTRRAVISPDVSAHARSITSMIGDSSGVTEIESRMVWSEASAARMIGDRVRELAAPRRVVSYMADPAVYGPGGARELRIGMAVDLTDDGLRLARRAACVSAVERSARSLRVTLTLRDDAVSGR